MISKVKIMYNKRGVIKMARKVNIVVKLEKDVAKCIAEWEKMQIKVSGMLDTIREDIDKLRAEK